MQFAMPAAQGASTTSFVGRCWDGPGGKDQRPHISQDSQEVERGDAPQSLQKIVIPTKEDKRVVGGVALLTIKKRRLNGDQTNGRRVYFAQRVIDFT
jgi:hypothetical protein